jgi:hypothetical protein
LDEQHVVNVAVVRQRRDIPAMLQKWATPIRRELIEIRAAIESGKIRIPMKRADAKPLKKRRKTI